MASSKSQYRTYNRSYRGRYRELKRSAKRRGYKFDLSYIEYVWLVKGARCNYCNSRLASAGHGLDRVDNKKGYCIVNAVPCCQECNLIKGSTLTSYEMTAVAQLLIELRRNTSKSRRRT